jgi:hypothetical protein
MRSTDLIDEIRSLAVRYRALTGRPLGVVGELAELEAARLLDLELANVRQPGFDAVRRDGTRLQIKGRAILSNNPGQRLGSIDLDKPWDAVLLVLLDADLLPVAIHEAARSAIEAALRAPGSKSRNERGALSVSKFKAIGRQVWARP